MAEKKAKEEKPDLEKIASEVGTAAQRYSLDQVLPGMYDALSAHSKQVDKKTGKITYKTEFSSPEKKKIADDMFDWLSYHVHVNIYKMDVDEWKKLKTRKDPDGNLYADNAVTKYFNLDRDGLRKVFEKSKKITPETVGAIWREIMSEHHLNMVYSAPLKKLDEKHSSYLRDWIKEKVGTYNLDTDEYNVEDTYGLQQLLPMYTKIAQAHYKVAKQKKHK